MLRLKMRKKSLVLADSSKWYLRPRLSRHANHPHLYCANQKWAQNSEQFAVTIQYFGPCGGTHLWKQWKSGAHASPPSHAIAHSTRTKRSIYLLIMYLFIYLFHAETFILWNSCIFGITTVGMWSACLALSMNAFLWKKLLFNFYNSFKSSLKSPRPNSHL